MRDDFFTDIPGVSIKCGVLFIFFSPAADVWYFILMRFLEIVVQYVHGITPHLGITFDFDSIKNIIK